MTLDCDCGFVAEGDTDTELVARAQAHARDAHGIELSAALILQRAGVRPRRRSGIR